MKQMIPVPPRSSKRKWKVVGGIAAASLAVVAIGWWAPGLADRILYGDVARHCSDQLQISGSVDGESIFRRHCRVGLSTHQTESGFFAEFEYARDGYVLMWGTGVYPRVEGDESAIELAMIRTPGDEGRWLCASRGVWRVPKDDNDELSLSGVGLLLDEAGLHGDGTLTLTDGTFEAKVGSWSMQGTSTGWSCDQDFGRCSVQAIEGAPVWAFGRSERNGELRHGFVLRQDQRGARTVGLAVATDPNSTFVTKQADPQVNFAGLTEFVECPQAVTAEGDLKLHWSSR